MRQVIQSAFVRAAVERATKELPSFRRVFEEGVIWQLQRSPLTESIPIPGTDPPVYVLETIAWRAEGIPRMRIAYTDVQYGIELVALSLDMPTKK